MRCKATHCLAGPNEAHAEGGRNDGLITKLQMTGLRRLHEMMAAVPTERHQFIYKVNGRVFDCLFWIGERPEPNQESKAYELSLTSVGETPVHIPFRVDKRYYIDTAMAPENYRALAALLRIHGASFQKLIPSAFLGELNRHIQGIQALRPPPKADGAESLNLGGASASEFFDHWRYHKPPRGPSKENQEKTLRLMGRAALEHSLLSGDRVNPSRDVIRNPATLTSRERRVEGSMGRISAWQGRAETGDEDAGRGGGDAAAARFGLGDAADRSRGGVQPGDGAAVPGGG